MFSVVAYPISHFESRGHRGTLMEDFARLFLRSHPLFHAMCKNSCKKPKVWYERVKMAGFEPNDIRMTVSDENKLQIHARHVALKGKDSDIYESKRSLSIPENVDTSKIRSHLDENGVLVIHAPLITKEEENIVIEAKPSRLENQTSHSEGIANDEKSFKAENTQEKLEPFNELNTEQEGIVDFPDSDSKFTVSKALDKDDVVEDTSTEHTENTGKIVVKETETENDDTQTDSGDKNFHLNLHLEHFSLEEISVSQKDNCLTVKAEKKREEEGLSVSQYYFSEHSLPSDIKLDKLSCVKNSDGKLVISAPYQGRNVITE